MNTRRIRRILVEFKCRFRSSIYCYMLRTVDHIGMELVLELGHTCIGGFHLLINVARSGW